MKKNVIFRIAAIVLMCTLVTACFASSTFAKYTSGAEGTATVTVAKWSIKVGANDIVNAAGTPASVTFNLFDTIKDTDGQNETDVASGKIAPGTQGSFKFDDIKNESEVNTEVTIKLTIDDAANMPPLQYRVDGGAWTNWAAGENVIVDKEALAMNGTLAGKTIEWKWDFNANGVDNPYGINPATLNATLAIVVDQVD
jgi:hypothetical protein